MKLLLHEQIFHEIATKNFVEISGSFFVRVTYIEKLQRNLKRKRTSNVHNIHEIRH